MNISNDFEEKGWQGIDAIMDLMEDNLLKFSGMTEVMPDEMRKYILAELDTIINKAWDVKVRRTDVLLREM